MYAIDYESLVNYEFFIILGFITLCLCFLFLFYDLNFKLLYKCFIYINNVYDEIYHFNSLSQKKCLKIFFFQNLELL